MSKQEQTQPNRQQIFTKEVTVQVEDPKMPYDEIVIKTLAPRDGEHGFIRHIAELKALANIKGREIKVDVGKFRIAHRAPVRALTPRIQQPDGTWVNDPSITDELTDMKIVSATEDIIANALGMHVTGSGPENDN